MQKIIAAIAVLALGVSIATAETDYIVGSWAKSQLGVASLDPNSKITKLDVEGPVTQTGALTTSGRLTVGGGVTISGGGTISGDITNLGEVVVSQAPVNVGAAANGGVSTNTLLASMNFFSGNNVVYTNVLAAPGASSVGKFFTIVNTVATNMVVLDTGNQVLSGDQTLGAWDTLTLYAYSSTVWLKVGGSDN